MEKHIAEKFKKSDIPYLSIDNEMLEIIYVLNFKLGIKTKYCCYGHRAGEKTYIMFNDDEKDDNVLRILEVVDSNIGTSGVKGVKLYKWARTMYGLNYKKPHYTKLNWMLEINYVKESLKKDRLNKITQELEKLSSIRSEENESTLYR